MVAILHCVYYHTMDEITTGYCLFWRFYASIVRFNHYTKEKIIVIFIVAALVSLVLLMFVQINWQYGRLSSA